MHYCPWAHSRKKTGYGRKPVEVPNDKDTTLVTIITSQAYILKGI